MSSGQCKNNYPSYSSQVFWNGGSVLGQTVANTNEAVAVLEAAINAISSFPSSYDSDHILYASGITGGGITITTGDTLTVATSAIVSQIATNASNIALNITKATLNANSILYAVTDNTPAALAVSASTVVGRKASGDIAVLSGDDVNELIQIVSKDATNSIVKPYTSSYAFAVGAESTSDKTLLVALESATFANNPYLGYVHDIDTGVDGIIWYGPNAQNSAIGIESDQANASAYILSTGLLSTAKDQEIILEANTGAATSGWKIYRDGSDDKLKFDYYTHLASATVLTVSTTGEIETAASDLSLGGTLNVDSIDEYTASNGVEFLTNFYYGSVSSLQTITTGTSGMGIGVQDTVGTGITDAAYFYAVNNNGGTSSGRIRGIYGHGHVDTGGQTGIGYGGYFTGEQEDGSRIISSLFGIRSIVQVQETDAADTPQKYIAGVMGIYDTSGVDPATTITKDVARAAILGVITNNANCQPHAVILAMLEEDGVATTVPAAFKAYNGRNAVGAGFLYGLDLYDSSTETVITADVRLNNEAHILSGTATDIITVVADRGDVATQGSTYVAQTSLYHKFGSGATVDSWGELSLGGIKVAVVELDHTDLSGLNATPVSIIAAPGASKILQVVGWAWEYTYVSAAYATNTDFQLITDTADDPQAEEAQALLSTVSRAGVGSLSAISGTTNTQLIANKALMATVATGDPTGGAAGQSLKIRVLYRIIDI